MPRFKQKLKLVRKFEKFHRNGMLPTQKVRVILHMHVNDMN